MEVPTGGIHHDQGIVRAKWKGGRGRGKEAKQEDVNEQIDQINMSSRGGALIVMFLTDCAVKIECAVS